MNLFWPVYKRIEDEVLNVANTVLFDDKQLDVYSLTIGDLLIRCVVEVEALSKELYLRLGGNPNPVDKDGNSRDLYFDTDCIKLLVDTWKLNKKKLQITNPNMYFSPGRSIIIPLHKAHKRGTSSSKWQQAYQAVKHYRTKSIEKATIENIINALGALYILNLYYIDEEFWLETPINGKREYTVDSKIFCPLVCDATHINMGPDMVGKYDVSNQSSTLEESIYAIKFTDNAYRSINKDFCKFELAVNFRIQLSKEYKAGLAEHPELKQMSAAQMAEALGMNYMLMINQEARKLGRNIIRYKEKEVVLLKNESIYPTLTYKEFLDSEEGIQYAETLANEILKK